MITHEIRKPFTMRRITAGIFEFGKPNVPANDVPMAVALRAQQQHPRQRLVQDGRIIPAELDSRQVDNDYEGGSGRGGLHPLIPLDHIPLARSYLADKQRYNEYVQTVLMKFRPGMFVTYRNVPIVLSRKEAPTYFIIRDMQEIRHLAQWDTTYKEPRVIGLVSGRDDVMGYHFVCPASIRELTPEEKFLVNLQHQQEKIKQATAPLSEEENPDRSGG